MQSYRTKLSRSTVGAIAQNYIEQKTDVKSSLDGPISVIYTSKIEQSLKSPIVDSRRPKMKLSRDKISFATDTKSKDQRSSTVMSDGILE